MDDKACVENGPGLLFETLEKYISGFLELKIRVLRPDNQGIPD
jgi:hypothetical protein